MTSRLWVELHRHALHDHVDGTTDKKWLMTWSAKVPKFTKGCACNDHWKKWLATHPPNFATRDTYFEWTVKAHNSVNKRLNKPELTVDQAKALYT